MQSEGVVEQQSPDWNYAANDYNFWQCTNDGTEEEFRSGGGTPHPDNCVHNPTDCAWDVDEQIIHFGYGNLETPNVKSFCVIAEGEAFWNSGGSQHRVEARVTAAKNELTAVVTNSEGLSWNLPAVKLGNYWEWKLCHRDATSGVMPEIPGSNGGVGRIITYTLTITPLTRIVRNASADYMTTMWNGTGRGPCPPYP